MSESEEIGEKEVANPMIKQGKRNRASGARFELKVRKDLESKGWIVDKWTNNVDLLKKELIIAKRKFNPFNRVMTIGTGFPDFIAFRKIVWKEKENMYAYKVIGVESKSNGSLSKEEKEKCKFLLDSEILHYIYIAKKGKKNGEIVYTNFLTKEQESIF